MSEQLVLTIVGEYCSLIKKKKKNKNKNKNTKLVRLLRTHFGPFQQIASSK
jgi:hypothetical protein